MFNLPKPIKKIFSGFENPVLVLLCSKNEPHTRAGYAALLSPHWLVSADSDLTYAYIHGRISISRNHSNWRQ